MKNSLIPYGSDTHEINSTPVYYPDTNIYADSRIIKKMQKLDKGILTMWNDAAIIDNTLVTNVKENKN